MNAPLSEAARLQAGQQALAAHLAVLRRRLEGAEATAPDPRETVPTLGRMAQLFGLSRFEAETLLLAAAPDLDGAMPALCAAAQGDPARPWPSFGLALAMLPDPHWSALTPGAPLRRWQLVEVDTQTGLAVGRLRVAEAVLHHLAGIGELDERLAGWVRPVPPPARLPASHGEAADRAAAAWRGALATGEMPPVLELTGPDATMLREAAAGICARAGLTMLAVAQADLPPRADALAPTLRLLQREAALGEAGLLIEGTTAGPLLTALVDRTACPLILAAAAPGNGWGDRRPISVALAMPEGEEARLLWQAALPAGVEQGALDRVVSQFRLAPAAIAAAARAAADAPANERVAVLWARCGAEAGMPAGALVERIAPRAQWDDLVLPAPQTRLLRALVAQLGHRATVLDRWGFAARGARGLGSAALFAGPSGTGKTMAAEVIAGALALDLYRIDLSQVVSKWLGETEKNLAQLFEAAEAGGAVLLFDEADALFGKRSEVKDSHDRYANIEVSYLLQRLESYRGLAVLATNSEHAVDAAFLRRLRFVVQFPLPDATQRAAIWRRAFPPQTPTDGLAPEKLSRLAVSGGTIRNIAFTAAYLAADAGAAVSMAHVRQAAEIECAKLRRPLSSAEIGDWTCA